MPIRWRADDLGRIEGRICNGLLGHAHKSLSATMAMLSYIYSSSDSASYRLRVLCRYFSAPVEISGQLDTFHNDLPSFSTGHVPVPSFNNQCILAGPLI